MLPEADKVVQSKANHKAKGAMNVNVATLHIALTCQTLIPMWLGMGYT